AYMHAVSMSIKTVQNSILSSVERDKYTKAYLPFKPLFLSAVPTPRKKSQGALIPREPVERTSRRICLQ
ncbi:putative glutamate synthase, partial [Clarias magur]